jgi:hypothetical protein
MHRGLLVIALLTACGSGTGLAIEIYPEDDAAKFDRVELFLAYDTCYESDCATGIAWPAQQTRPDGTIRLFRDERRIAAEYDEKAQRATIHLTVSYGYQDPSALAIVGYKDKDIVAIKVIHDAHIPLATGEVWKVYLHHSIKASTVVDPQPDMPKDIFRALEWDRAPTVDNDDPAGCIVYQKWEEGEWNTEYFVPKSDPDCDGKQPECSPYWYDFNLGGAHYACAMTTDVELDGVCHIGSSACIDGRSATSECGPDGLPRRCLADELCRQCSDAVPVESCLSRAFASPTTSDGTVMPYSECAFHPNFDDPNKSVCSGGDQKALLTMPVSGSLCTAVELHTLATPIASTGTADVVIGGTADVRFSAQITDAGTQCMIAIYWKSGSAIVFSSGVILIVRIAYANGNTLFYPVKLYPDDQSCKTAGTLTNCVNKGPASDQMFRCVTAL